jgi:hypothetical protein
MASDSWLAIVVKSVTSESMKPLAMMRPSRVRRLRTRRTPMGRSLSTSRHGDEVRQTVGRQTLGISLHRVLLQIGLLRQVVDDDRVLVPGSIEHRGASGGAFARTVTLLREPIVGQPRGRAAAEASLLEEEDRRDLAGQMLARQIDGHLEQAAQVFGHDQLGAQLVQELDRRPPVLALFEGFERRRGLVGQDGNEIELAVAEAVGSVRFDVQDADRRAFEDDRHGEFRTDFLAPRHVLRVLTHVVGQDRLPRLRHGPGDAFAQEQSDGLGDAEAARCQNAQLAAVAIDELDGAIREVQDAQHDVEDVGAGVFQRQALGDQLADVVDGAQLRQTPAVKIGIANRRAHLLDEAADDVDVALREGLGLQRRELEKSQEPRAEEERHDEQARLVGDLGRTAVRQEVEERRDALQGCRQEIRIVAENFAQRIDGSVHAVRCTDHEDVAGPRCFAGREPTTALQAEAAVLGVQQFGQIAGQRDAVADVRALHLAPDDLLGTHLETAALAIEEQESAAVVVARQELQPIEDLIQEVDGAQLARDLEIDARQNVDDALVGKIFEALTDDGGEPQQEPQLGLRERLWARQHQQADGLALLAERRVEHFGRQRSTPGVEDLPRRFEFPGAHAELGHDAQSAALGSQHDGLRRAEMPRHDAHGDVHQAFEGADAGDLVLQDVHETQLVRFEQLQVSGSGWWFDRAHTAILAREVRHQVTANRRPGLHRDRKSSGAATSPTRCARRHRLAARRRSGPQCRSRRARRPCGPAPSRAAPCAPVRAARRAAPHPGESSPSRCDRRVTPGAACRSRHRVPAAPSARSPARARAARAGSKSAASARDPCAKR